MQVIDQRRRAQEEKQEPDFIQTGASCETQNSFEGLRM